MKEKITYRIGLLMKLFLGGILFLSLINVSIIPGYISLDNGFVIELNSSEDGESEEKEIEKEVNEYFFIAVERHFNLYAGNRTFTDIHREVTEMHFDICTPPPEA